MWAVECEPNCPCPNTHIPTLDKDDLIGSCDDYLSARTGKYEWRRIRYRAALAAMMQVDLEDTDTVFDIGAGWTEFDYCLRVDGASRCRYIPVDGAFDGTDLETWVPPRETEFFVALELVEHLEQPYRLIREMQVACSKGVILSTPNPETTDVLGMDPTHKTPISKDVLWTMGFHIYRSSFYGQEDDSYLCVYYPDGQVYDHQLGKMTQDRWR
jgi:hypothetical protein